MLNWLLDIPFIYGVLIFVFALVIAGALIFISVHHLFIKPNFQKAHYQVSKLLFRTSASLLAMLLSFTYANQRIDYFTIKNSIQAEASTLVDIHMDLAFYGSQEANEIQKKIRAYVKITLEEGWEPITRAPFESQSFREFRVIYKDLLSLEANGENQTRLKANLLEDADALSDYLQVRFYKTRPESPYLFYLAFFGFVVVMILFSAYKPDKISILFVSLYNCFIGVVLYFIVMMNNPLVGPLQVKAEPFEILKETIEKNIKE